MARPKRSRPWERVNYKLDSDIREILSGIADRHGRNEGSQVEQLVLQGEAIDRLVARGEELSMAQITKEVAEIWGELTKKD